jgi:hypothetical protein
MTPSSIPRKPHPPTIRPPWRMTRRTLSLVNLVSEEHQKLEESAEHDEAFDDIGVMPPVNGRANGSAGNSPRRGREVSAAEHAHQAEVRRSAALMKSISLMPGYVSELQIEGLDSGNGEESHEDMLVPSMHRHSDHDDHMEDDIDGIDNKDDDHDNGGRRHRRHASMYRGADDDEGSDVESGDEEERKRYEAFPV